jgi:hypothetical protein
LSTEAGKTAGQQTSSRQTPGWGGAAQDRLALFSGL